MQCVKCDHVFRNFYYDDKILDNYWDKEGDLINVHSHVGQSSFRSKYLSDQKSKLYLNLLKKEKLNGQILDVVTVSLSQVKRH